MDQSLGLMIQDNEFIFDYRRAIFWSQHRVLIVADLHWGKDQFLRSHGVAVSDEVMNADLSRLSALLHHYDPRTLLVLGDLIHHEKALTPQVIARIAHFRQSWPCELILIKGNHDRYTDFPMSWGIVEDSEFYFQDFLFSHEYHPKEKESFQFAGHIHPMMRLRAGHDQIRLPSFILRQRSCLLPAFSYLTGGQDMRLQKGERAILVMEEGIEMWER